MNKVIVRVYFSIIVALLIGTGYPVKDLQEKWSDMYGAFFMTNFQFSKSPTAGYVSGWSLSITAVFGGL